LPLYCGEAIVCKKSETGSCRKETVQSNPLRLYIAWFYYMPKKSKGLKRLYGLQVKTIDISELFGYTIGKDQGGE
jgi:hypothetical protein